VGVTSIEVSLPDSDDELPIWGETTYHFNTTGGRPGGATSETDFAYPLLVDGSRGNSSNT